MTDDQLLRLYNGVTGYWTTGFYSIFDRNLAFVAVYNSGPITIEGILLREVYEELQKELPTIKKKVIAKAIRELKEEYMLSLRIELEMDRWKERFWENNDVLWKIVDIDRKLKNEFKNYIKNAFKDNRVEWHWWNNLEWGL